MLGHALGRVGRLNFSRECHGKTCGDHKSDHAEPHSDYRACHESTWRTRRSPVAHFFRREVTGVTRPSGDPPERC